MPRSHSLSLKMKIRCRKKEILGSHSLHLMMKNQYEVRKKSNREKAKSLLDDEKQLRGAEEIKCREGKVYH